MFCQVPTNSSWLASTMAGSQPRRGAWLLTVATSGQQSPVEQLLSLSHQISFPLVSWCTLLPAHSHTISQAENSSAGDWRTPEPAETLLNTITPKTRSPSTSTEAYGQLKAQEIRCIPACNTEVATRNQPKRLWKMSGRWIRHHLHKIPSRALRGTLKPHFY